MNTTTEQKANCFHPFDSFYNDPGVQMHIDSSNIKPAGGELIKLYLCRDLSLISNVACKVTSRGRYL